MDRKGQKFSTILNKAPFSGCLSAEICEKYKEKREILHLIISWVTLIGVLFCHLFVSKWGYYCPKIQL